MIRKIFKSQIQCPNCEGCGKMARYKKNEKGVETFICEVCNGSGVITGDITIIFDDESNKI